MTGRKREREIVTHAAFPLGTSHTQTPPQAISQHPCDVTRSRGCSRSVLSLFGRVHFYSFYFFFLAEFTFILFIFFSSRKFSDEFCDCASLSRDRDVIQVIFYFFLKYFSRGVKSNPRYAEAGLYYDISLKIPFCWPWRGAWVLFI